MIAYCRRPPFRAIPLSRVSLGKRIVHELGAVRNEAVVPQFHEFTDKCVGLYPAPIPNNNAFLDFHERAHEALVPNLAVIDIGRLDNRNVGTKTNVADRD